MFSGVKSDFMMEAVPYFEGELLEMILNEDEILLQFEKESSHILFLVGIIHQAFAVEGKTQSVLAWHLLGPFVHGC